MSLLRLITFRQQAAEEPAPSGIITDGLALHLDAGDVNSYPGTGTTWTDLSGNGRNCTLFNTTFSPDNNGVLLFNNTTQITGSNLGTLSVFTCMAFVLLDIPSMARMAGFLHTPGIDGIRLTSDVTKIPRIFQSGGISFSEAANLTPYSNQWMHITFVFTGTQVLLYYNGVHTDTVNKVCNFSFANFIIGRNPYDNSSLIGRMSNFLVYNKVLTIQEIQQNFNATKNRFGL